MWTRDQGHGWWSGVARRPRRRHGYNEMPGFIPIAGTNEGKRPLAQRWTSPGSIFDLHMTGYYEYADAPADFAPPGLYALPTRPCFHSIGGGTMTRPPACSRRRRPPPDGTGAMVTREGWANGAKVSE